MTDRDPTQLSDLPAHLQAQAPAVICVGLSAYDQTWEVAALPAGGGKRRALDYRDGGGGMAATAAVAVARLGGRAYFWGRAGDDTAGHAMRAELNALGVDISAFRLFAGARSPVAGIVVDPQGERSIFTFMGSGMPEPADWLPLPAIREAAAVLADPRWPQGALAAFRAAREAGIPTVLDGDVATPEVFDLLLPWVDCAVFSEPGLAGYAGGRTDGAEQADDERKLRFALSRGCRLAAVTLGERGVSWTDGGPLRHQAAFSVHVVDTTGAGDVFHGALALALGAGVAVADAFRFSAAVAALKCTRPGGRKGIPGLAAVLSSLNQLKES